MLYFNAISRHFPEESYKKKEDLPG